MSIIFEQLCLSKWSYSVAKPYQCKKCERDPLFYFIFLMLVIVKEQRVDDSYNKSLTLLTLCNNRFPWRLVAPFFAFFSFVLRLVLFIYSNTVTINKKFYSLLRYTVPVRRWGSIVPRPVGLAEQASGLLLRCTLKGFEKNHQLKILSNSMIHVRLYSTDTSNLSLKSSSDTFVSSNSNNINPWLITGFTDAEGCFGITIRKKSNSRWYCDTRFMISLHKKDLAVLQLVQAYFLFFY